MVRRNPMLPRRQSRPPSFPDSDGWFRITNLADTAQVHIYAEIGGAPDGGGVRAEQFCQEVQNIRAGQIDVRLNSPGGDVFDGIAIHNALKNHPAQVNVYVDGIAASIASVIAMAGDNVTMAQGSQMMIHEGHTAAVGDAQMMAKTADLLNKCSDNIATFYAARAGGTVATWRERMRAETWYSADEAVAVGLADAVAPAPSRVTPKASWDLSVFNHAGRAHAPAPDVTRLPHVTGMAPPSHDTAIKEGTWDAGANVGRLPSPVPVGKAKAEFAVVDTSQEQDGAVPKDACKLPHHFVDGDGNVGSASADAVRNALARLGQTQGLSGTERSAAEAHLRAHLSKAQSASAPQDSWTTLTAHLTHKPAASTTDPVLAALREAL